LFRATSGQSFASLNRSKGACGFNTNVILWNYLIKVSLLSINKKI
jgi:hypothetical protein